VSIAHTSTAGRPSRSAARARTSASSSSSGDPIRSARAPLAAATAARSGCTSKSTARYRSPVARAIHFTQCRLALSSTTQRTGAECCSAVGISFMYIWNAPSPVTQTTSALGRASLAPIAPATPRPITVCSAGATQPRCAVTFTNGQ